MSFLRILLVAVSVVMISNIANAEQRKVSFVTSEGKVNRDSVLIVKLIGTISKDSLKLVTLQSQVAEKTKIKEETAAAAQKLADENNKIARRLSHDPLQKKLAKKADKLSSEARSSAKKARIAADALKTLNKNIVSLERKIAKDQAKLDKIRVVV